MNRVQTRTLRGFTLIELVASAVLTAIMAVGLINVLATSLRESQQLKRASVTDAPLSQFKERMRCDLHNARGMAFDANSLVLHGFLSQDPQTRQATWRPGSVRYSAGRIGEQDVLLRTANGATEVVWWGFVSIRIQPLAQSDPEAESMVASERGGLPEIPSVFQIFLSDVQGRVLWREVIHHHAS